MINIPENVKEMQKEYIKLKGKSFTWYYESELFRDYVIKLSEELKKVKKEKGITQ